MTLYWRSNNRTLWHKQQHSKSLAVLDRTDTGWGEHLNLKHRKYGLSERKISVRWKNGQTHREKRGLFGKNLCVPAEVGYRSVAGLLQRVFCPGMGPVLIGWKKIHILLLNFYKGLDNKKLKPQINGFQHLFLRWRSFRDRKKGYLSLNFFLSTSWSWLLKY